MTNRRGRRRWRGATSAAVAVLVLTTALTTAGPALAAPAPDGGGTDAAVPAGAASDAVPGAATPVQALPATPASPAFPTACLGGAITDDTWYNDSVGLPQIIRSYDSGFHYATWQDTRAYARHGNTREDYSFKIPPAELASGAYDDRLRTFLASTPRNFVFTNYHEPEQEIEGGLFTAAEFRAAIVRLAALVHAQNAVDHGTRTVSVTLMGVTFSGFKGRNPLEYWPGNDPATGRPYADLISVDTYSVPHGTTDPGYSDGTRWRSPSYMLDPAIAFAAAAGVPWLISEFGFPEDLTDPTHKASAITEFVAYALEHGAVAIEYFDMVGGLGDWRLAHSADAAAAWATAVQTY